MSSPRSYARFAGSESVSKAADALEGERVPVFIRMHLGTESIRPFQFGRVRADAGTVKIN